MSKGWIIAGAAIILLAMIGSCSSDESETNQIGSSTDWGEGHYWNSQSESVEDVPWG